MTTSKHHLRGGEEVEEEEHGGEGGDVRDLAQVVVHIVGEQQHGQPDEVLHRHQPRLAPPERGNETGVN